MTTTTTTKTHQQRAVWLLFAAPLRVMLLFAVLRMFVVDVVFAPVVVLLLSADETVAGDGPIVVMVL